jgi:hypothetical protein
MFAPNLLYPSEHTASEGVLPALRELLNQCIWARQEGPETLSEMLWTQGYLPFLPQVADVEAAREALVVDEELLP